MPVCGYALAKSLDLPTRVELPTATSDSCRKHHGWNDATESCQVLVAPKPEDSRLTGVKGVEVACRPLCGAGVTEHGNATIDRNGALEACNEVKVAVWPRSSISECGTQLHDMLAE